MWRVTYLTPKMYSCTKLCVCLRCTGRLCVFRHRYKSVTIQLFDGENVLCVPLQKLVCENITDIVKSPIWRSKMYSCNKFCVVCVYAAQADCVCSVTDNKRVHWVTRKCLCITCITFMVMMPKMYWVHMCMLQRVCVTVTDKQTLVMAKCVCVWKGIM